MHIIGAGGHGKVVAELIELNQQPIDGFIDEMSGLHQLLDYPVYADFPPSTEEAIIAIGDNLIRKRIALQYPYQYPVLIHPKACVSKRATLGKGTVVIGGATINIGAKIGQHVIVNTNASVGHDCLLGDFVHIAPNAALAGNVCIGEGTNIGLGAAIKQGVHIGSWCLIGAGAVVIENIPDNSVVVGNPGRVISRLKNDGDLSEFCN